MPIERKTVAAGQRTRQHTVAARRFRVEQQQIGAVLVARGGRHVFGGGDRDRFHHRTAEARLDRGDPLRAFPSVKLEEVERRGVKDSANRGVVGIDKQTDPAHRCGTSAHSAPARAGDTDRGLGG